jgi:hypothetical protein
MDGKAARVAETEAEAEGIKIASRAHVFRYYQTGFGADAQSLSSTLEPVAAILVGPGPSH